MKKIRLLVGYFLILTGILINLFSLYNVKKEKNIENNKIAYTLEKEVKYREIDDTYNSILSIPKINLKKGIYSVLDNRNNIEENIMIHKDSNINRIILIAHSGTGDKAFFKDLDKLDYDSLIEYYYNHTKYVYKVNDIYEVEKRGVINLKNSNKKTINLITCNEHDKTKQIVYMATLIDEIKY